MTCTQQLDDARAITLMSGGAAGVLKRLGLCKDMLDMLKRRNTPQDKDSDRMKAEGLVRRRMSAIRTQLLPSWEGGSGESLADMLLVPSLARETLEGFLASAASASAGQKVATGLMVSDLLMMLKKVEHDEMALGLTNKSITLPGISDQASLLIPKPDPTHPEFIRDYAWAEAITEESTKAGAFDARMRTEIAADALADTDVTWSMLDPVEGPVLTELIQQIRTLDQAAEIMFQKVTRAKSQSARDKLSALINQRASERKVLYDKYKPLHEKLKPKLDAHMAMNKSKGEAARAELQGLIDHTVQASSVDAAGADRWAQAQDISPEAIKRLQQLGYSPDQVRKDMAECYRFVQGRIEKLRIITTTNTRAWANLGQHGDPGLIAIGEVFNKCLLWHEMGHHLEADPAALAAAKFYIRARATAVEPVSMNALTRTTSYRDDEAAFPDHFFEPYVGKVYAWGSTEVFSMGLESFSTPALLAKRMLTDPETLEFVRGYLLSPMDTMQQLHLSMRQSARQVKEGSTAEIKASAKERIKQLVAESGFVIDTDDNWMEQYPGVRGQHWNIGTPVGHVVVDGIALYICKKMVRNHETNRTINGYVIYRPEKYQLAGHETWWLDSSNVATGDLAHVKALATLWARALKGNPLARRIGLDLLKAGEF